MKEEQDRRQNICKYFNFSYEMTCKKIKANVFGFMNVLTNGYIFLIFFYAYKEFCVCLFCCLDFKVPSRGPIKQTNIIFVLVKCI